MKGHITNSDWLHWTYKIETPFFIKHWKLNSCKCYVKELNYQTKQFKDIISNSELFSTIYLPDKEWKYGGILKMFTGITCFVGAYGSIVDPGIMLEDGRLWFWLPMRSLDVSIDTSYGLDDQRVEVRIPVGSRILTSPALGLHPASNTMCTRSFFPG
jgi:hypothetical protein